MNGWKAFLTPFAQAQGKLRRMRGFGCNSASGAWRPPPTAEPLALRNEFLAPPLICDETLSRYGKPGWARRATELHAHMETESTHSRTTAGLPGPGGPGLTAPPLAKMSQLLARDAGASREAGRTTAISEIEGLKEWSGG
jgi:hypothetical protein